MKPLPPTNAELRQEYAPFRTWIALSVVGVVLTILRNVLYDIPLFPLRSSLAPFVVVSAVGAIYAGVVQARLAVRRRIVR